MSETVPRWKIMASVGTWNDDDTTEATQQHYEGNYWMPGGQHYTRDRSENPMDIVVHYEGEVGKHVAGTYGRIMAAAFNEYDYYIPARSECKLYKYGAP